MVSQCDSVACMKLLPWHPRSGFIQYIAITWNSLISCAPKVHLWVHTTDVQSHQCAPSSPPQLCPVLDSTCYGWWIGGVLHCLFQQFGGNNTEAVVSNMIGQQLSEGYKGTYDNVHQRVDYSQQSIATSPACL